jgi:hypothetical protein
MNADIQEWLHAEIGLVPFVMYGAFLVWTLAVIGIKVSEYWPLWGRRRRR